jgi:hypothetical protein
MGAGGATRGVPGLWRGNVGIVHNNLVRMAGGATPQIALPGRKIFGRRGGGSQTLGVGTGGARGTRVPPLPRRSPARPPPVGAEPGLAAASSCWRACQETALELPDETLELVDTLTQGRVLGSEVGERRGGLIGARLPPAGDSAPRGTDARPAAARKREPTDLTQTAGVRRMYVTRREVRWEGRGRIASMVR